MFLRSAYNYDMDVDSFKSGLDCSLDPSRAQQHMRDECDINVMVERFARTGEVPPPPPPGVVDFDEVYDFQSSMNVILAAQRSFDALPAKVRKRFDNDPGQMLAFVGNESNRAEAIALGLVPEPPKPTPAEPEPISAT